MEDAQAKPISRRATVFHGGTLPERDAALAGYAALIDAYSLRVPLPHRLAAVSQRHRRYEEDNWAIFTPRHMPPDTVAGHLAFALRWEGVDLGILRAIFIRLGGGFIADWVRREPVGRYSRRAWFFYEWLMKEMLPVADAKTGNFVEALDPAEYCVGPSEPSRRHRVHNNLPGARDFCPLIRRTGKINAYLARDWTRLAHEKAGRIHADVLARAAAFLLLQDSRASFALEGENPGRDRAERWGRAIGQAGLRPITMDELLRLQTIVIAETRFVKMGLRTEGGFIGAHDRNTDTPLPDHISARWQDLARLMQGLIETDIRQRGENLPDAVLAAATIAFGFVFIHPFADGNGRIHRYLIHHVLAERGFTPRGIVFPVSAVILDRVHEYRQVLESYSRPRLECIDWRPTEKGNVEVLNDTIDLYRYFDATLQAEFLYDCVAQTIEKNLPEEILFLDRYDRMKAAIKERFDMPDPTADLLIRFLRQNNGALSKRARAGEFGALSDAECRELEALYATISSDTEGTG
jgi:hypothetical protein